MADKITINRGLVQLKLNQKKIDKALKKSFITYKVGAKVRDESSEPKAAMDKVKDLITYGEKVKAAIMAANATTTVTINDEVMTIAAAIEKKRTINHYTTLISTMRRQLSSAKYEVDSVNEDLQSRLDRLLEANLGKDLKARDAEIEVITKAYKDANEASLVDPISLEKRIEELEEYVDGFMAEVDLCLSEVNATTYIEV